MKSNGRSTEKRNFRSGRKRRAPIELRWIYAKFLCVFFRTLNYLTKPSAPATTGSGETFRQDVLEGLASSPKRLPSKLFYDEPGSQLFDEITHLPEYYLTRSEIAIFTAHLADMAARIGPDALVIEFGTGAGVKTRMLLETLEQPRAYIPIDISQVHLDQAARSLRDRFPLLDIKPLWTDYTNRLILPTVKQGSGRSVIFFPGSTIGNFEPREATDFLKKARDLIRPNGALLVGYDRTKDPTILEAAYNDVAGITAKFNLHLIERIAQEFASSLSPEDFEHLAFFNNRESRIEMHLVSRRAQHACLAGNDIYFAEGEHIITEYSYKYTHEGFQHMLTASGFALQKSWTDDAQSFEVSWAIAT